MSRRAAFQGNAFQFNAFQTGVVTSTAALELPVDYYMENLPQYRATGRTYEPSYGKAGKKVIASAGPRGRISGPAPSVTRTTNSRGYD